jgi:hypothetical protein
MDTSSKGVNLQIPPTVERARVRLPSGSMADFGMRLLWEFCLHRGMMMSGNLNEATAARSAA